MSGFATQNLRPEAEEKGVKMSQQNLGSFEGGSISIPPAAPPQQTAVFRLQITNLAGVSSDPVRPIEPSPVVRLGRDALNRLNTAVQGEDSPADEL